MSPVGEDCQLNWVALCQRLLWTIRFHSHLCETRKLMRGRQTVRNASTSCCMEGSGAGTFGMKTRHTSIRMSCPAVMCAQHRGSTTTVLMSSMRMAGPLMTWPGLKPFNRYAGVSWRPPICAHTVKCHGHAGQMPTWDVRRCAIFQMQQSAGECWCFVGLHKRTSKNAEASLVGAGRGPGSPVMSPGSGSGTALPVARTRTSSTCHQNDLDQRP